MVEKKKGRMMLALSRWKTKTLINGQGNSIQSFRRFGKEYSVYLIFFCPPGKGASEKYPLPFQVKYAAELGQ